MFSSALPEALQKRAPFSSKARTRNSTGARESETTGPAATRPAGATTAGQPGDTDQGVAERVARQPAITVSCRSVGLIRWHSA